MWNHYFLRKNVATRPIVSHNQDPGPQQWVCNNQKVVQNDSLKYRFLSSQNSSSTFIYSILDIWAILVMNGAGLSQLLFVCSLATCDITCRQGKCQSHSNVQPHVLIITRDQQNIFGQLSRFWLLRFYPLSAPQKNTTMRPEILLWYHLASF